MSATEQTYPEPLVARVLGPKKFVLVGVRHAVLKKGRDWRLVDGVVCYTPEGLALLCQKLKLDAQLVVAAAPKNSPGGPAGVAHDPTAATGDEGPGEASAEPGGASAQFSTGTKEGPTNADQLSVSPPVRSEPAGAFARREPVATVAATVAAAVVKAVQAQGPVDVLVTGCSPNPLIVFGTVDGTPVRVRVRNNANFIRGLVLRATPGPTGVYQMVGQPPRWKGDKSGFTR